MRKWLPFVVVAVLVLLIDQTAKIWVVNNLVIGETILPIPALHPYFQITRSFNTGAAFGILPGASGVFLVLSIIIIGAMLYVYAQSPRAARLMHIGLALIVGGAIGNVIDRLTYGHVVDFFHVRIPGVFANVSNFADHAIVLGVILLLIDNIGREWAQRRAERAERAPAPDADGADVSPPPAG